MRQSHGTLVDEGGKNTHFTGLIGQEMGTRKLRITGALEQTLAKTASSWSRFLFLNFITTNQRKV